jgi:hypothetical protein
MKNILFRLMVAAALTLAAVALSSSAHGQQADLDATPRRIAEENGTLVWKRPVIKLIYQIERKAAAFKTWGYKRAFCICV